MTLGFLLDPMTSEPATAQPVDADDFRLDLTVVESFTGIPFASCDTSDGCGNTCQTSACNSSANDPS